MENKELIEVASRFDLKGNVESVNTLGEGFINDTFIVTMSDIPAKYILQKKNKNIFKDVPGMMDNIVAVTEHLKRKIVAYGGNPLRETLTQIPVLNAPSMYYTLYKDEYWCMTLFIEESLIRELILWSWLNKGVGELQNSNLFSPISRLHWSIHCQGSTTLSSGLNSGMPLCQKMLSGGLTVLGN